jgi:ABC-type transport system substrate-binding protein
MTVALLMIPAVYAVDGPVMNRWISKVIKSPDAQVKAMKLGDIDMYPGLIRPGDAEELGDWGAKILSTPGFHFCYIGTNIRPWDYDTDGILEAGWPAPYDCAGAPVAGYVADDAEKKRCMLDVNFRLAVAHLIPKEEIIGTIFKYIVVRSDTPCSPALGRFFQDTPKYPFDPDEAVQILLDAGYYTDGSAWYYDAGMTDAFGEILVASPTYEEAPTSFTIVKMMTEEMANIGLNVRHDPQAFPYPLVWNTLFLHQFDMYFLCWGLTRFPDHFYSFFHSDNDICYGYNTPGVNNAIIDNYADIIKTSLDLTEVITAAKEIQLELIDVSRGNPAALCYIPIYSRNYFDAYEPDLDGLVNMLGYGSDNSWTARNFYWGDASPGEIRYVIGTEPYSFNPLWSSASDEIALWGPVFGGLIMTDPYKNDDMAWEATDWSWGEYVGNAPVSGKPVGTVADPGMKISFTIREGVKWHSGRTFDAYDCKFSWDYIYEFEPSRYLDCWNWYVESHVSTAPVGGTHAGIVDVYVNTTSLWLVYDYAGTGSRLDSDVWDEVRPGGTVYDGHPRDFEPSEYDHPNTVTITDPHDSSTFTLSCMCGTGEWIWKDYDNVALRSQHVADRNSWVSQAMTDAYLTDMLYWAGDVNTDAVVDGEDLSIQGTAFGSGPLDPRWDGRADVAPRHAYRADLHPTDNFIDIEDLYITGASIGKHMEY